MGMRRGFSLLRFHPMAQNSLQGQKIRRSRLWEIPTGKLLYTLGGVNSPQVGVEVLPVPRPGEDLNELQMDDVVDIENETIRAPVFSVAFSPDGTKLASASLDDIRLWEVGTGNYLTTLTNGLGSASFSVAFSPDSTKLASGSWDDKVEICEVSTPKHIATFPGHTGNVYAVAFSPDGTKLASGSFDGTVLLWDVPKSIKLYSSKQNPNR